MANWKHNAMKETRFWLLVIVFKYHCSARPYGHESALSHGSMQKQGSILLSSTFGHMPKSMVGNHNYVVSLRGLYTKRFVVCDRCYDLPILTKVEQMKYTLIGHPKLGRPKMSWLARFKNWFRSQKNFWCGLFLTPRVPNLIIWLGVWVRLC